MMTTKTKLRLMLGGLGLTAALALIGLFPSVAPSLGVTVEAQTYNSTTTLTNAITDRTCNSRTITVGSTTGWTAGMNAFFDSELVNIASVTDSTHAVVSRCAAGTGGQLHSASTVIFWGVPSIFVNGDTDGQGRSTRGACTASNYQYLPIINIQNGNVWLCRAFGTSAPTTAAQWTATNVINITYNSLLKNLS